MLYTHKWNEICFFMLAVIKIVLLTFNTLIQSICEWFGDPFKQLEIGVDIGGK